MLCCYSTSGAGTFFEQGGGGTENIKYKFRFAKKMANHLHQLVISIEAGSYTIFN